MEEYLCVIRQDEGVDWYMLCVRNTFFCIASGPLKSIKESIREIRRRYRTVFGLQEALSNMSERITPSPATQAAYKAIYKAQEGKYDIILKEVMEGEYERIKEGRKVKPHTLVKKTKTLKLKKEKPVETAAVVKKKPLVRKMRKAKPIEME